MKFVCAQQDNKYCVWQCYVQQLNFRRLGISQDSIVLFLTGPSGPSFEAQEFAHQHTGTTIFYEDTRQDKRYTASVYPHAVKKLLGQYGSVLPSALFFHDADVIFRELPLFHNMLEGPMSYFSTTEDYMGYRLYTPECLSIMGKAVDLDYTKYIDKPVGGAQLLLKNTNVGFWHTIETRSNALFQSMNSTDFDQANTSRRKMEPWLASMWALLWTLHERGIPVETHPELDFIWPMYDEKLWHSTKILHNAGVLPPHKNTLFHKGSYTTESPFRAPPLTTIDKTKATVHYYRLVREVLSEFRVSF